MFLPFFFLSCFCSWLRSVKWQLISIDCSECWLGFMQVPAFLVWRISSSSRTKLLELICLVLRSLSPNEVLFFFRASFAPIVESWHIWADDKLPWKEVELISRGVLLFPKPLAQFLTNVEKQQMFSGDTVCGALNKEIVRVQDGLQNLTGVSEPLQSKKKNLWTTVTDSF